MGSVCQYRFTDIRLFGRSLPILKCDTTLSAELRQKYLLGLPDSTRIVGVSWRGGGRVDRIKQKSINTEDIGRLMLSVPNVRFVSLQYGESKSVVDKWCSQGVNIYHDDSINPLKDLDSWHAQVAACDAVVSVANTTIHGRWVEYSCNVF